MLEYRNVRGGFQIWSTGIDSLSINLDTDGIFEKYADEGSSWKEAMSIYVKELYDKFLGRFCRENPVNLLLTAKRIAYHVIEEKRFDKKYSPEAPISELLSDYENGVKTHRGENDIFWDEGLGEYVE